MSDVAFPEACKLERLSKSHPRSTFSSGNERVDDWLATKALQQQKKHLSVTSVLLEEQRLIGYYTLAMGQIRFDDLPIEVSKHLPQRDLPVAVLAWLGVDINQQGRGLGKLLLAKALRDCYDASQTFAFIAVIVDCIDDRAKTFYSQFDFQELPGYPYRLYVTANQLQTMMATR